MKYMNQTEIAKYLNVSLSRVGQIFGKNEYHKKIINKRIHYLKNDIIKYKNSKIILCPICNKKYLAMGKNSLKCPCQKSNSKYAKKQPCKQCGKMIAVLIRRIKSVDECLCRECLKKNKITKDGISILDQYRGRKCPDCGVPVDTGYYRCKKCTDIFKTTRDNETERLDDNYIYA